MNASSNGSTLSILGPFLVCVLAAMALCVVIQMDYMDTYTEFLLGDKSEDSLQIFFQWLRPLGLIGFLAWVAWVALTRKSVTVHLFDRPGNVRRLLVMFYCSVIFLLLIDFVVEKHHLTFRNQPWFGFYAFYGFVACVILVLIAKYGLRVLVERSEDYYD